MLSLVTLFCSAVNSKAQAVFSTEYDIKAALLFNLTQFVEWPPATFANTNEPVVIGVLGENPFGGSLQRVVEGEKVNGRPVMARAVSTLADTDVHVLFISRSEASRLDRILPAFRGRPILLVSDIDQFAGRGGMVRFATDSNRVRLVVNLEAAERANLKLSSKLLRISEIVKSAN